MDTRQSRSIEAEPYSFDFVPAETALIIIDMQRDFLEPGGFGEMLGNDVSQLRRTIEPNRKLVDFLKSKSMPVQQIETLGDHNWMVWRDNLSHFAPLLFQQK